MISSHGLKASMLVGLSLLGIASIWLHLVNKRVPDPYLVIVLAGSRLDKTDHNRMSTSIMAKPSNTSRTTSVNGTLRSLHPLACT